MREHHKDQLLDVLFHYMPQTLRARVMCEAPLAYNAYCQREVVKVVRTRDDSQIHPDREPPTVHLRITSDPDPAA